MAWPSAKLYKGFNLPWEFVSDKSLLNEGTCGRRDFFPPAVGITLWIPQFLSVSVPSTATARTQLQFPPGAMGGCHFGALLVLQDLIPGLIPRGAPRELPRWPRARSRGLTRCSRAPPAGSSLLTASASRRNVPFRSWNCAAGSLQPGS